MRKPHESIHAIGGCYVHLQQRKQGNLPSHDGYVNIVQAGIADDGVYSPAQSVSFYVTAQPLYEANKPIDDLIEALIDLRAAMQFAKERPAGSVYKFIFGKHGIVVPVSPI